MYIYGYICIILLTNLLMPPLPPWARQKPGRASARRRGWFPSRLCTMRGLISLNATTYTPYYPFLTTLGPNNSSDSASGKQKVPCWFQLKYLLGTLKTKGAHTQYRGQLTPAWNTLQYRWGAAYEYRLGGERLYEGTVDSRARCAQWEDWSV